MVHVLGLALIVVPRKGSVSASGAYSWGLDLEASFHPRPVRSVSPDLGQGSQPG